MHFRENQKVKNMMRLYCSTVVMAVLFFVAAGLSQAATKDEVIQRGYLQCGVSTGLPGFSNPDEKGNWAGLDVDICRAVAAALLGDATKVKYISLMAKERSTALLAGEVDILSRNTSWTLTRDSAMGLHFAGISFYDRQGYLVAKRRGAKNLKELDGASICMLSGTTVEQSLTDDFNKRKMQYKPLFLDTSDQMVKAFEAGRCDIITTGQAQLYGIRRKLTNQDDAVMFPDLISKEPLGPAVRQGDDVWFNIVKWSLFAMINGEELKITSANLDTMKASTDSRIRRFMGLEGGMGKGLGLPDDWAYQIIRQVGNYGESFERNLGMTSSLNIKRGLNELWSRGGILYAPPLR